MSQIFKKKFDSNIIFTFLKKYSEKEKNNYIFSQISYKKAIFNKEVTEILKYLKDYYHKSKQFYLTRNITYKNFLTVLRQVCNYLCIPYTSKIIYNCSKYNIIYIFYLDDILNNKEHQNSENTKVNQ